MQNLNIKLLGILGDRFGRTHKLSVDRFGEGLSYLRFQFDDWIPIIAELSNSGIGFTVVFTIGQEHYLITDPQWFDLILTQDSTLSITPIPVQSGETGKFLLGVGLIAVSAFMPASIGILGTTLSSSTIGLYGAGLVVGSVINWLSPKPKEAKTSTIAGATANNSQGSPIPIVYGRRFVTPTKISGTTEILDFSTFQTRGEGGFFGIGGWSETYLSPYSIAKLQIVDALCEGPIKGLATPANPYRSIWLNGVPMRSEDGTYSYLGLQTETYDGRTINVSAPVLRPGAQNDAALPNPWNNVRSEIPVGWRLRQTTGPAVRRINQSNLDAIVVRLYWDSCNRFGDRTGQGGLRVAHQISIKEGNGPWVVRHVDDIYALSTSPFEREFKINVGQASYYEIKVERTVPDQPAGSSSVDAATWKSYITVINANLRYPNTAKVGIEINLERFGATEIDRRYHIDGRICKIPSNATVRNDGSLQYSGLWDGILVDDWTSDPAWCLYDLCRNNRFGCVIPDSALDKYAFYSCSAYCSALVDDGFGGQEPRFSLNVIIKDRQNAYELIKKLCGVFNAIAFYEADKIIPVVDRPTSPTHQFSSSNATFKYQGTPQRTRRNRFVVSYTRPDVPDLIEYEYDEDTDNIFRYGVKEERLEAFGCTSRGQAKRLAKWSRYTEINQVESIIISTGMNGATVLPGDVVIVGDSDRGGLRRWGRIEQVTSSSLIVLDRPITIPIGTNIAYIELPDGSISQHNIINSGSNQSTLNITPLLTILPDKGNQWAIAAADLVPTFWRVVGRSEPELFRFEISAVAYQPNKWTEIETGLNLKEPPKSVLPPDPPIPVQSLTLISSVSTQISASWLAPSNALYTTGYEYQWKQVGNVLSSIIQVTSTSVIITIPGPGSYEVQVRAIDSLGKRSGWITSLIDVDVDVYFVSASLPISTGLIYAQPFISGTSS